jgi:hypothetical protein
MYQVDDTLVKGKNVQDDIELPHMKAEKVDLYAQKVIGERPQDLGECPRVAPHDKCLLRRNCNAIDELAKERAHAHARIQHTRHFRNEPAR